jgi:uncharacterized protein
MNTKMILHHDTSLTLIRSFSDNKIQIGDTAYNDSIIVTSGGWLNWFLKSLEALTPEHFAPLFDLEFDPELVILGTGNTLLFPRADQTSCLSNAQIGLEVMDTAAACRTYNILADDGRRVVACLIIDH